MFKILLLAFLCLVFLSSCSTIAPHVSDRRDPFTGVHTRAMVVGPSNYWYFLESMAALNTMYYYPYLARKTAFPLSHLMTLSVSRGDTILTLARLSPEEAFDVPENALLQLKFMPGDTNGLILDLPLIKPYHTIHGVLLVRAKVNQYVARDLQREKLDIIRISQVSTNQADLLPVDWYITNEYGKAFQKGVNMLFYQPQPREAKPEKPAKTKGRNGRK